MTYDEFLTRIIDDGIEAARKSYSQPKQRAKLEGSLEGFEACRGLNPAQLLALLEDAGQRVEAARRRVDDGADIDEYWKERCRESEIEWTANCLSAVLANQGMKPIVPPTARGVMKAAEVVGVEEA